VTSEKFRVSKKEVIVVISHSLKIQTKGRGEIINLTPQISDFLFNSEISNGIATVCVPASTASIITMEFEEGVEKDLQRLFEELVSSKKKYAHDKALGGEGNGVSHVRASLFGPSVTIPFNNKKLALSVWEQIVLVDFDLTARTRDVVIQLVGE
jgi:secondary thiamine-phosphate synthase enzyme